MCNVLTYEQIDRTEWSRLVASSSTGTWFQTPEAYDFFAAQPELFEPYVVGITCDLAGAQTQLRGVCVGYVTKERSRLKQFFTRRAIILGGPCLADDATMEEVEELMRAVTGYGLRVTGKPIYIETRNFNDYSRWRGAFEAAGFSYQPHLNFHVDTSSVDIVEANLGKSRKRDIKTTVRDGVTLVYHPTHEQEHQFYSVLKRLYDTKVKTPLFPESFFQTLAKHPDGRVLLTEYNGKIIGGTVCVVFCRDKFEIVNHKSESPTPGVVYEWFVCGEDGVYPHIFPSCYATYAGIRYAAEHGYARFDMMGAGRPGEAYGVRDFKARFGGKEVEHGRFLCVTKPLLYKIGTMGVKLLKRLK